MEENNILSIRKHANSLRGSKNLSIDTDASAEKLPLRQFFSKYLVMLKI